MSTKPIHPTPARYKVLADSYIGDMFYPASTPEAPVYVDYDGHPGSSLAPTDDEGARRQSDYFASRHKTADQAATEKRRLTQGAFDPGVVIAASDAVH
jgi:hypothetical protein